MTTLALYRKYRPRRFEEVVGQDEAVAVLRRALEEKTLAHAYLFSGTRGVGKTTIARILAREAGASEEDIIEMDAASNRGIDDIRRLREEVFVRPFRSPRKVYIIDEVHMLTREAFNAFLKVLEEPPDHVVFVLATTEEQKVPATIRSRCVVVRFKSPSVEQIQALLRRVALAEEMSADDAALSQLAHLSEGSYRDALVLLQQAIDAARESEEGITPEIVYRIAGAPQYAQAAALLRALGEGAFARAIEVVAKWREDGTNPGAVMEAVVEMMRFVLYARTAPDLLEEVAAQRENVMQEARKLAQMFPSTLTSRTLAHLLRAQIEGARLTDPLVALEVAVFSLAEHRSSAEAK